MVNLIFWCCMYFFWLGFNASAMPNFKVNLFFTLIDFICFASIAFLASHVLIPRFLYKKKYWQFILLYILVLTAITSLMVYLNFLILQPFRPVQGNIFSFKLKDLAGSYLLAFFLSSASTFFKLLSEFYSNQSTIVRLREEKLQTELDFLKQQVNPHSFFNILNTIYFQIDIDKEAAKEYVLQFSKLFRYQLYECDKEKVPVSKEIEFLKNYVDINKARYDADYKIDFEVSNSGNPQIAPFLLFPLVENSFKHVSQYPDKLNFISLFIEFDDKQLNCLFRNSADNNNKSITGIGLRNLNRRLDLLYRDHFHLQTKFTDGIYQADLKIIL